MPPETEIETPETPNPETPNPAPETPEPPSSKPASQEQVQDALKALADIQKRWASEGKTVDTQDAAAKAREQIKEKFGWTDEQLDFHQNSLVNAVAPLQEQISWMELEKKHPDIGKFKDAMQKELADGYAPAQRANPMILEKVYYLAKGRAMETTPPSSRPGGQTPKPRINPGYPGFSSGADDGPKPTETTLTDEQRQYARFLRVPEEKYKRAAGTKNVLELKEQKSA